MAIKFHYDEYSDGEIIFDNHGNIDVNISEHEVLNCFYMAFNKMSFEDQNAFIVNMMKTEAYKRIIKAKA